MFALKPLEQMFPIQAQRFPTWLASFEVCDFDEHAFWFATFTSFVSPFGGFFTAAFKRTLKLRTDFGQGPFADRLDCHLLTGVFVFTYVNARIAEIDVDYIGADAVLHLLDELKREDRVKVYQALGKNLAARQALG